MGSGRGLASRPQDMNRLVIGAPDKTNILLRLIEQDVEDGFLLIDPTGQLAEHTANIIPKDRTEDVFYLDPSDLAFPSGFNVLDGVCPDDKPLLVENICSYFEAMFPNGWGAQSNYILANCLRILLDTPGSTILGVLRLLKDDDYRSRCIANCHDPIARANWDIINAWDTKQYQSAVAPLLNKVATILMSPSIRNILCQTHSTFSLSKNKIVIANLDRAKVGDLSARLLGGLLLMRSTGRVYVTDLAFFASDHFASFLSQDRFTVSVDFLDQLPRKLALSLQAIENKYVLKTNYDDAKTLSFYVGVMNPRQLTELSPEEVYTSRGIFEPTPPPFLPRLAAIRRRSRACHTRPRHLVEAAISHFLVE